MIFFCLIFKLFEMLFRNSHHFSHSSIFIDRRSISYAIYCARETLPVCSRLTINAFCKWSFWNNIIFSILSKRAWILIIISNNFLKSISLWIHSLGSNILLIFIFTHRHRESISTLKTLSNAWLIHLQSSLINRERHIIILNRLSKVRPLIFTCSSCIRRIDMIRVNVQYSREIINSFFNLP